MDCGGGQQAHQLHPHPRTLLLEGCAQACRSLASFPLPFSCIFLSSKHPNQAVELDAGLLRCGKSCRLRWTNYLRPDLKRGLLSEAEEKLVIELHSQLGNRFYKNKFI